MCVHEHTCRRNYVCLCGIPGTWCKCDRGFLHGEINWRSHVTERTMLRWDVWSYEPGQGNEGIIWTTKVGEITKKVQVIRLKWYGHVMRRKEHYVGRRAVEMEVHGRRKRESKENMVGQSEG